VGAVRRLLPRLRLARRLQRADRHHRPDAARPARPEKPRSSREEIRDIVNEIIAIKNVVMSIAEQEELLEDICNDVLGYGPLEPLLARDDIADIMVNGAGTTYIEVGGKMQRPTSASATTRS
jgi:Flp pilus assembly CpaF family ATPase